ncbi:MAG: cytochrome P460 family protein [Candidatus Rokuibacteriota bacterium]
MRRPIRTLGSVAALAAVAGIFTLTPGTEAGPDKIAYPAACKVGSLYTIADRYDVKQYRELYTTPEAVRAAKEGKPLPAGTVITLIQYKAQVDAQGNPVKDAKGRFLKGDVVGCAVMEKRAGWGAEYPDDLRNGEWEYSAFGPDGKFNDKANFKACFQCHKPHDDKDFVISYPAMAGKLMASSVPVPAGNIPVNIAGFVFAPGGITVAPGKTVTWVNTDDSPHQVTVAGTKLKTDFLLKGQAASLTFAQEGVFSYNCALHPNMKGSVEVKK